MKRDTTTDREPLTSRQVSDELWGESNERLRQQGLDEAAQAKRFDARLGFVCSCSSFSSCPNVANAGIDVPNLLKRQID